MAQTKTNIQQTLTNVETSAHDFELGEGGAAIIDAEWLSGTPTIIVTTKIPGGTNFIDALTATGATARKDLTTDDRALHFELLGQAGQLYRVASSGTGASKISVSRGGVY